MSAQAALYTLHFNWYGQDSAVFTTDNIHIVNPGATASVVCANLSGQPQQCLNIAPGGGWYVNFPGASGGPVPLSGTSGPPVLASQRVILYQSFHEINALDFNYPHVPRRLPPDH